MTEPARLPAHLEVASLIRRVGAAGGFAAVLAKGERETGTIALVLRDSRTNPTLFERMPQLDGTRPWVLNRSQNVDEKQDFEDYLERRKAQDPDLWIIELDIANPERFIRESD